jgi:hypothetical protein
MAHHGSYGHDEQEKGGDDGEICSASMHRGNYEPEAALVECGARGPEGRKQRQQESSELGWPYTHARAATREGERESGMMREEGLAPHLDPVGQFSFSPVYL